jgi:hypothetical protein
LAQDPTPRAPAVKPFLSNDFLNITWPEYLDRCLVGGNNVGMPQEERELINGVERRLADKYAGLPLDHISAVVRHAYAQFRSSRVKEFIPLLVQRRADEQLEELSVLRPDLAAMAMGEFVVHGPFAAV